MYTSCGKVSKLYELGEIYMELVQTYIDYIMDCRWALSML